MDAPPQLKIIQYAIKDVEDLTSPVWGAEFEVTRLHPGILCGRITHALLGDCAFSFGQFHCQSPLRGRGAMQPGALSIGVLFGTERPAQVWGVETNYGGGAMLSSAGGEYDTVLPAGRYAHAALILPALSGFDLARSLTPQLVPQLRLRAFWQPSQEARKTLKDAVAAAKRALKDHSQNPGTLLDVQAFSSTLARAFLVAMEQAHCSPFGPSYPSHVRIVRDVEDLLRQEEPPAAGVPALCLRLKAGRRSVERAFQQFLGISPLQYMMAFRLCRARKELAGGGGSVTEIATKHGFYELGRFAERYKQLFGQLPSETLAPANPPAPSGRPN